MELVRPEQIRCRGRTPEEVSRAAETCDEVLEMLAEDDADQALARGIIDERLHLLGSVATQPRAARQPPIYRTAANALSVPNEIGSRSPVLREERKPLNVALILCIAFNLGVWAASIYGVIMLVRAAR